MPSRLKAKAVAQKVANIGVEVLLILVKAPKAFLASLYLQTQARLWQMCTPAISLAELILKVFIRLLFF